MSTPGTSRQSERIATLQPRTFVDSKVKLRILQKRLAILEKDNMQDDPHANLSWHKAVPKFDETFKSGKGTKKKGFISDQPKLDIGTKKGKKLRSELSKTRFRKDFAHLKEDFDKVKHDLGERRTYDEIVSAPSVIPARKFCSVCGLFSSYTCFKCGSYFCSMVCNDSHAETRCLKWTS
ncbi:unnamed protein product [Bursaphelenchus xylophilus]|uniref:(pine wood nematode) hypothetical protein n=1 Tax=Bursaphelenchus xylophilus TaxID=6326 RepID=A0A1I7SM68_BURXY|nr:unnamed protein product [Bursaphelenchus xylophilus]CAG9130016.1 unnamed protein product [Bursaphelenchus xylophilus]